MDPEKKLTFCHGVKAEEEQVVTEAATSTMSFQEQVVTEAATVSLTDKGSTVEVVNGRYYSGSLPLVRPKFCPGVDSKASYLCETGHCCGETGCCTYYYELWWFWLLWTILILFSCFCAYRHCRAKLRIQQQQRQREINLIAYNRACNYPSSMPDLNFPTSFKLPSYDETAAQPSTPPPPYSSIFAIQGGATAATSSYPHHQHHRYPCPPYPGPGPGRSILTSSQGSDNYTSCSCESCSLTSPCSTLFSIRVTDETFTSSRISTPSEAGDDYGITPRARATFSSQVLPDVIPAADHRVTHVQSCSSYSSGGDFCPRPSLSLPLHPHSSNPPCLPLSSLVVLSSRPPGWVRPLASDPLRGVSTLNPLHDKTPSPSTRPQEKLKPEEEEEEEDEEDHFRHRRLTGDSGIEVCRCHVRREEELKKGEKNAAKERGRVYTMRPAADDSVSDDCEQVASPICVVHRTGDAVITLESV
ncbi:WW domain binding protein 1-like isoform X2 [Nothobranchius furzeri]|uniref:WW domain binding protein 1-like isoform X2 n=1 Tax=Nothobranchius furzeri TaxID=105023 RepID=UPI002403FBCA|nr:uncharacterized protein LOC107375287 isoform X2 [Nothobranchius furzeri]